MMSLLKREILTWNNKNQVIIMKKIFIFLMALIQVSCDPEGYGGYRYDYNHSLDNYIVLDKGEFVGYTFTEKERERKGIKVKYFRENGDVDSIYLGIDAQVITSYIERGNIVNDENYVLLSQKPMSEICECNYDCLNEKYGFDDSRISFEICESYLWNSKKRNYWIINQKKNYIYGPLTKKYFLKKKKELGVPKNLKLKW